MSCLDNLTTSFHHRVVLDAPSKLPLYQKLAEDLFAQIRKGVYAPGSKIPSEHELSARHQIGRPTVRQATELLIQRGVLVRKRGSGTFVRGVPAQVDLFSLAGTFVSFEARGIELEVQLIERPKVEDIREEGHPLDGRQAVRIVRLSRVADEPVLLEKIDFDAARFVGLARMPLKNRSLSEIVEQHFQMRPQCADQVFRVQLLDKATAELFDLPAKSPLLRVDRTLHFGSGESLVFARMLCRTDRFQFSQRIGGNVNA